MSHRGRAMWRSVALFVVVSVILVAAYPSAANNPPVPRRLIPIGASYQVAPREQFIRQVLAYNSDTTVTIRVLLAPFVTDPYSITNAERQQNLLDAQIRATQIDTTCDTLAAPLTCSVTIPDVQTRADALLPSNAALFGADVDGMYMLGGDQTFAMLVLANTPVEAAMDTLYNNGAPFSGNSAGAAVQSRYMIAGYTDPLSYGEVGFRFGAVDLWYGPTNTVTRGLSFGLDTAVLDQHVLERGRLPRLIQAAQRLPAGVPKIGVGVDWGTGVVIENEQIITGTAGFYAAIVVDEETYGSAANATYAGESDSLSIRDVAFHVLPEGAYGYDLAARKPIVDNVLDATQPDISGRSFELLAPTANAGSLFLGGDLWRNEDFLVSEQFAAMAQMYSPTLVLAAGFANDADAQIAADDWAGYLDSLGVTSIQTAIITPDTDLNVISNTVGLAGSVLFTGNDQALLADSVGAMKTAGLDRQFKAMWAAGRPMLFDNAAAALAGEWMTAMPPPDDIELEAQDSFLAGTVAISPGLGLVANAVFEPSALYEYRYGRMVSHAVAHPDAVVYGIERNTALEITGTGATVRGEEVVLVLDGRYARVLEASANDAWAATWLFLDTYTTAEQVFTPTRVYLPIVLR